MNELMSLIKTYLKYILVIIVIGIACLVYHFINSSNNSNQEIISVSETTLNENKPPIIEKIKTIYVDVKGAVNNPGVYALTSGSRVIDAIEKSGGLTNKADTSVINLSKILQDEMVIIVYTKDEVKSLNKTNEVIKYVEKECVCPKITNDACFNNNENNNTSETKTNQKLSLNSATLEELQILPGIGQSKALEIITYRETNGGFKNIEELINISGIGQATFEKLKNLVTI